jgi:hypothetical protein
MASKKQNDWLNEEYSAKQEKKPTLRQYLKELPKDVRDIKSTVRVIWLPGRWDNYTLETDDFRIIVNQRSKLYAALRNRVDDFTKGSETLDVHVTDRATISYRISTNPEESGEWFFIADGAGLRFTRFEPDAGNTDVPF